MKQVLQKLKTGEVTVESVPVPGLKDSFVLVRNISSVISAGTEKSKIDLGKKNLIQKALARPDLAKQVIKKVRTEGLKKTFQTVDARLDAPSPLGYSCAGEVIAVGGLVKGLKPGDRVACAGAGYANHAEVIAVPKNLVVKIPKGVTEEEAAFSTMGSIALQGVRLATPLLGEKFLVLGLGLLGQITVQILKANGCEVYGVDLDPKQVELAEKYGAIGIQAGDGAVEKIFDATEGLGVDGVLVCAGTSSNQPIEFCGEVTREKGRVVVVGAVKMDIPRDNYFKKEISVVISRSYGPGRYDPFYEEAGNDYPVGYVRFTEQRNMETILGLLENKSLDVASLITHRFGLEDAPVAYDLIEGKKTEPYLGIVINYAEASSQVQDSVVTINPRSSRDNKAIKASFIGAGNYATASLLPHIQSNEQVSLAGLATASGRSAQGVAKKYGFEFCVADPADLMDDKTNTVFITTRHDSHAELVAQCFDAGKHVYVEKPLALSTEELARIVQTYNNAKNCHLFVGFNRRFSPSIAFIQKHLDGAKGASCINIRVNAGSIPAEHWVHDPIEGGGRLIGEGCHFVDLACAIAKSKPTKVFAQAITKSDKPIISNDNVIVTLQFDNQSIATITYTSEGSKAQEKERVEVYKSGYSAVIDDFKTATVYTPGNQVHKDKLGAQDKGQKNMLATFIGEIAEGKQAQYFETFVYSSLATILAAESIMIGQPLEINLEALNIDD